MDVSTLIEFIEHYDLILLYSEYNHDDMIKDYISTFLDYDDNEDDVDNVQEMLSIVVPTRNHIEDLYDYVKQEHIDYLRNCYQPEQKSDEWYKFRNNKITASSAWKLLHTSSTFNEFVYKKCCPIDLKKYTAVNINSPFHWGNKYEDVSVSLYEHLNNVKSEDFGCITHPIYPFLAASPDGIVVSEKKRGTMLEIKNIVNRDITGIPKKEYWIQMQLQMEVCNLNDCDFLECRFKEYETEEDFNNDGTFTKTKTDKHKGIIVHFFDGIKPFYEYAPFMCSESKFNSWYQDIREKHKEKSWIKTIYWYLDEYSCVHIKRNPLWFQSSLPIFAEAWQTIEKEKKTGYLHRKPKQRERKSKEKEVLLFSLETISKLL